MDKYNKSLIVKLRYQMCDKCTDAIARLDEPYARHWSVQDDSDEEDLWASQPDSPSNVGKPIWTWTGTQLAASAQRCNFCQFLEQILIRNPIFTCSNVEDIMYVQLKSHLIGASHIGSQYNRYYKPRIQIFQKKDYYYSSGPSTFILPLIACDSPKPEDGNESDMFYGRPLLGNVRLDLVRYWIDTCHSKHVAPPEEKRTHYSVYGLVSCKPETRCRIPHFRLIDIRKNCVVDASAEDQYVALSYVWGSATRLLLCKDNIVQLSLPGGLSPDKVHVPRTFQNALQVTESLGYSYLWIDALCIRQDDDVELSTHMDRMDMIYGSAILTIVSNTPSADTGIPGIGYPRPSNQVVFQAGNKTLISTSSTFGQALRGSPWESRGWTLQEKVFSKRLLIFTETQTFFHCRNVTWYEETLIESKNSSTGGVHLSERSSPSFKSRRSKHHLAYEAHKPFFHRGFWQLVEIYVRRQLSFEQDAIHAFSGILRSIGPEYGPAVWGIPQTLFGRGLTWRQSSHIFSSRGKAFPSWSWAGWKCTTDVFLRFLDVLIKGHLDYSIQWHFYQQNDRGEFILTLMPCHEPLNQRYAFFLPIQDPHYNHQLYNLSDHPGGTNYAGSLMEPLIYSPSTMPPLSHIIRFWTSSVFVTINREQNKEGEYNANTLSTGKQIDSIPLDSEWRRNAEGPFELIVISESFETPDDSLSFSRPSILLNLMLIEWINNVAFRIQICSPLEMNYWRALEPTWKMITMA